MSYTLIPFHPGVHDVNSFTCGTASLDEWLKSSASTAVAQGTAQTHVWAKPDDTVVGYLAFSPHTVSREAMSPKRARGELSNIPAILLAKMAVRHDIQGQGHGKLLLLDGFRVVVEARGLVGGRLLVVDPLNEDASRFYQKHGFWKMSDGDRLAQKIGDISRSLG